MLVRVLVYLWVLLFSVVASAGSTSAGGTAAGSKSTQTATVQTTRQIERLSLRLRAPQLGSSDWLAARVTFAQGCTMLLLAKPTPAGYSSLMLSSVAQLQANVAGRWVDVAIAPLTRGEAPHCLESAAD